MTMLSVVIPVFQGTEELLKRLPLLLEFLDQEKIDFEVILVDDGSQDGSEELLKSQETDRVRVFILEKNVGKFGALKAGMLAARGDCCLFTDADIPYDLLVIPPMVDLIVNGGFHIVVGDRTLPRSVYRQELSFVRNLATRAFTSFVRLLVTGGLTDTQCGIKAMSREVAEAVFPLIHENNFAGDVEMLYIALIHNLAIRRVPVHLRHHGPSTVHPVRDGLGMLKSLLTLRFRRSRGAYHSEAMLKIADQDFGYGDRPQS